MFASIDWRAVAVVVVLIVPPALVGADMVLRYFQRRRDAIEITDAWRVQRREEMQRERF